MRDRLIELIKQAKKQTKKANCDIERNMIFADYLLASGVIVPTCKVGDKVYAVDRRSKLWWQGKVICSGIFEIAFKDGEVAIYDSDDVFLTREEAEKALKDATDNNVGDKTEKGGAEQ